MRMRIERSCLLAFRMIERRPTMVMSWPLYWEREKGGGCLE